MKLRHFVLFGGVLSVIIALLLFLFIVTADDKESSTSHFDFSGLKLSEAVSYTHLTLPTILRV